MKHLTSPLKTLDLTGLTKGQRRIVALLLRSQTGLTYQGVADRLGVSLGTVYQQLKRIRDKHPETYSRIMAIRKTQLAYRHDKAVERERKQSRAYFRRRYAKKYKAKYGFYPSQRRALIGRKGKMDFPKVAVRLKPLDIPLSGL
jgi:IS30 family transposase